MNTQTLPQQKQNADKNYLDSEIADAKSDLGKINSNIEKTTSTGQYILIIAAVLSAILAAIGFGSIVDDIAHQIAVGFVVLILSILLGKRATLSIPQVKPTLVYIYCSFMVFISAAFFVLGFVGDDPVRYSVSDQIAEYKALTIKYKSEDLKMEKVLGNLNLMEKHLRDDAENERVNGALSGFPGNQGVVYKTYLESADFIAGQRLSLEKSRNENIEIINSIVKSLNDFQEIVWDKTLHSSEIQKEGYTREHQLRELFVNIKQNTDLVKNTVTMFTDYSAQINTKRADKTNNALKGSQMEVIDDLKKLFIRYADDLDKSPFVGRQENTETITITVPDVYMANIKQIPRYFFLWIIGIMLDIAAPLILYIIIGHFIKKRDEIQEQIYNLEKKLEM
ncbi:MAG: hypothetical protein MUD00_03415 [Candidatus Pacebacteria bacterium]|jgi:F0F1-type ATP synthase assembly protein I|nr:hypothetical protein [Candidatus Paceibacterota bacterium]